MSRASCPRKRGQDAHDTILSFLGGKAEESGLGIIIQDPDASLRSPKESQGQHDRQRIVIRIGSMYACAMNSRNVFASTDPKSGVWTQVGTFDSDRYGDANIFIDDDGRFFMYFGWAQLLPIQVVELDPKTFKEIGKPVVCFFGLDN